MQAGARFSLLGGIVVGFPKGILNMGLLHHLRNGRDHIRMLVCDVVKLANVRLGNSAIAVRAG